MESPLCLVDGSMERKLNSTGGGVGNIGNNKMNSSLNSTLDEEDTTPSDSGVQMLDSESSEIMIESITSQTGFEFEDGRSAAAAAPAGVVAMARELVVMQLRDEADVDIVATAGAATDILSATNNVAATALQVDSNSNVTSITELTGAVVAAEDIMTTSACSTFDTTEQIVYRRKSRKAATTTAAVTKAPKKRVSFHEDILKNTRTDNIHIEHGFITYKNGRKMVPQVGTAGRYSWCSEGDSRRQHVVPTEICAQMDDDDCVSRGAGYNDCGGGANSTHGGASGDGARNGRRHVVYRNACSDVLDYGNSDVYDTNESACLHYDNSGVFEYQPQHSVEGIGDGGDVGGARANPDDQVLYRCSCSSSNSSLDSEECDKNSNRQHYGQAKSSSCDCIGMSNANINNNNNNIIGDNCYFSEPNMNSVHENCSPPKKSVWNKEKKPKSSCLKKNKRHTNIIHEHDLSTKMKKFNVHDMNQLLDNSSKMLFGSLKSIFTMPLPERGVPEGSEDLQAVVECTPELEETPEHKAQEQTKSYYHTNGNVSTHTHKSPATSPPPAPPQPSVALKQKPFLSKSLDGSKQQQSAKQFIHNVDKQLRRKNDVQSTRQSSAETNAQEQKSLQRQDEFEAELAADDELQWQNASVTPTQQQTCKQSQANLFRNKFIINCESTVFEHVGVSYETSAADPNVLGATMSLETQIPSGSVDNDGFAANLMDRDTPIAQPEAIPLRSSFISATPIAKTFSSFFRSIKESAIASPSGALVSNKMVSETSRIAEVPKPATHALVNRQQGHQQQLQSQAVIECTFSKCKSSSDDDAKQLLTPSSSGVSELSSDSIAGLTKDLINSSGGIGVGDGVTVAPPSTSMQNLQVGQDLRLHLAEASAAGIVKPSRHLPSPLKKRNNAGSLVLQPARYGCAAYNAPDQSLLSPDLFNVLDSGGGVGVDGVGCAATRRGGYGGRDSKSTVLSEELDDILTITTDTDNNASDIVIIDYPELNDRCAAITAASSSSGNFLRPTATKTSLINRFLRNVTQKKIIEASIRKNDFFSDKLRSEQRLFTGNLYVRGAKPKNYDLIDDLNAEIAMEIEMSGVNSPRRELANIDVDDMPGDISRFELGIGEISIEIFNGNYSHILRDNTEQLLKVFKLYTGYTREGYMTPVLVFLTDKTLYVTDLVRNRLCSKFVLAYVDLDVILMGPYGNTVLLSNSDRDMQQVLLAGGPYPADGLVANLELCARRSGSTLPAVGQLTLGHLAPLQAFVREHSCVGENDVWMYYAVVNVPAGTLGNSEQEPLGPHVKGFLMQRRVRDFHVGANYREQWNPGYFLLKAGVLYMFNDSGQKLPSWAMALAECQGARRAVKAGRPHCFEIMLKGGELLQMAAPDEYVASEWLQALLQSASGLFEMQEKHKTLGCTLVVTENHLITLREDFTAPLRQMNKPPMTAATQMATALMQQRDNDETAAHLFNTGSLLSSTVSTPTRATQRSCSSLSSTPTRHSQISSRSSVSTASNQCTITSTSQALTISLQAQRQKTDGSAAFCGSDGGGGSGESFSNMSSVYGRNCGLEILTCADIKEMTGIKIPSHNDTWWCILEFSCQEVRESSDDLVIFFASSSEMQRFLRLLENLWQSKNNDLFPITVLDEDEAIAEQCTMLYMDINRSWEPLLSAALGYPL